MEILNWNPDNDTQVFLKIAACIIIGWLILIFI